MAATLGSQELATVKLDPTCLSVSTLVPLGDDIPLDFNPILSSAYQITRRDISRDQRSTSLLERLMSGRATPAWSRIQRTKTALSLTDALPDGQRRNLLRNCRHHHLEYLTNSDQHTLRHRKDVASLAISHIGSQPSSRTLPL